MGFFSSNGLWLSALGGYFRSPPRPSKSNDAFDLEWKPASSHMIEGVFPLTDSILRLDAPL